MSQSVYNRLYYLRQKDRIDIYKELLEYINLNDKQKIKLIIKKIKQQEKKWDTCLPQQKPGPKNHKELFKKEDKKLKKIDGRVLVKFD